MTFDMYIRVLLKTNYHVIVFCNLHRTQNVQRFSLITCTLSKEPSHSSCLYTCYEPSIDKIETTHLKITAHATPATCTMRIFDKKVRILWLVIFVSVVIYIAIQDISPLGSLGKFFSAVWNRILETEIHVERDLTKLIIYSWTR